MKLFYYLLVVLFLVSCNSSNNFQKYQLVTTGDGSLYRLDTSTGEIKIIEKGKIKAVREEKVIDLQVGSFYKDESWQVVKYSGKLNFEKGDYSLYPVSTMWTK